MYLLKSKTRLLLSTISISTLFFFLLLFTVKHHSSNPHIKTLHLQKHLQIANSACQGTLYYDLCVSTLSTFPDLTSKTIPQIISETVKHCVNTVKSSSSHCSSLRKKLRQLTLQQTRALDDCLELFDDTIEQLQTTLSDLTPRSAASRVHDIETFLSAAIANQYTCLDGFAHGDNGKVRPLIQSQLYFISKLVSNSLAMVKKIKKSYEGREEKQLFEMENGFPSWVSSKDRKLLQATLNGTKIDLVVAKDGSGNFTTISEAVAAAPNNTAARFVIHIKAGGYFENVDVERPKKNLMFVGDGMGKTVVKASRNVVDGWTTFRSATVAVVGDGFIAKDMTFENSAGPSKHQAVALRSGSDFSTFYRCSFVGYQDTLYVHSLRQFYRECDIYGTIDFVFGDASAVLQNCNLYARRPDPNQRNIFTAQGRQDPNQNTGISIQNCKVAAAADLIPVQSSFRTYLGRPWREYSRTVFLQSYLGDLIDPAGWLEWDGNFALSTLYYGEYKNRGPGSNTTGRVTWPGYRVINSSSEANQFTVVPFIQGDQWLPGTRVPFSTGLT